MEVSSSFQQLRRRKTVSSLDLYSSSFNSRTLRRLRKLTNRFCTVSTTAPPGARFYLSDGDEAVEEVSSTRSEETVVGDDRGGGEIVQQSDSTILDTITAMEAAKKLRKFIQRRLTAATNGEQAGPDIGCAYLENDAIFRVDDCEHCSQNCQERTRETIRMEKKIKKFLRNENLEKCKSQDRKSYATLLTLLLNQYHAQEPSAEESHSTPSAQRSCNDTKIHGETANGGGFEKCQQSTHCEGVDERAKEDQFEMHATPKVHDDVLVRLFACTISRSNFDETFGVKFRSDGDSKSGCSSKIASVIKDSPAFVANLKAADKIIAVNGRRLEGSDHAEIVLEELLEAKLVVERIEGRDGMEDTGADEVTRTNGSVSDGGKEENARENCSESGNNSSASCSKLRTRAQQNDDIDLERWLDRIRVYPRGTIMDRFPEARAFLRLMGRGTYSEEFRDCNM